MIGPKLGLGTPVKADSDVEVADSVDELTCDVIVLGEGVLCDQRFVAQGVESVFVRCGI